MNERQNPDPRPSHSRPEVSRFSAQKPMPEGDSDHNQRNKNPHRASQLKLVLGWQVFRSIAKVIARSRTARPPAEPSSHVPRSTRSGDRLLYPGRETSSRQRWGTFFIFITFLIGLLGAIGFVYEYWSGGSDTSMGVLLACGLGGFGVALVFYSHWLIPEKQVVEPREELPSGADVLNSTAADFNDSLDDIPRRGLLKWIAFAVFGAIAASIISLIRSLGANPDRSLFDTIWKRGQRLVTEDGTPVSTQALQPGNFIIVFPENSVGDERAQTVLLRVDQNALHLPADRSDWAPLGYLAYSRVCTHAGCSVGLFETTTDMLVCPCHQSTFDVLRAAKPTSGPAARPLPQLPLYADADGNLRAGGGFSEPPGPGFWEMP